MNLRVKVTYVSTCYVILDTLCSAINLCFSNCWFVWNLFACLLPTPSFGSSSLIQTVALLIEEALPAALQMTKFVKPVMKVDNLQSYAEEQLLQKELNRNDLKYLKPEV